MASKRPRSNSVHSESSSEEASRPSSPTTKVTRLSPSPSSHSRSLICTLPPTCARHPTHLDSVKELESHYAKFHTYVCEEPKCGCVFPDARLLELHQTECHDPIAAVRQSKGEKIFACFVTSCPRHFLTPKSRRLHLIQTHGYPKEYFFAVTNKGVGELLKKWGGGASLLRGEWKPREGGKTSDDDAMDDEKSEDSERNAEGSSAPTDSAAAIEQPATSEKDEDMATLTGSLSSLSLIPSTIRFGRGSSKAGGFKSNARARGTEGAGVRGRGGGRYSRSSGREITSPNDERHAHTPTESKESEHSGSYKDTDIRTIVSESS